MPARSALLTARAEYSARRPIRLERVHIASASRAANDAHTTRMNGRSPKHEAVRVSTRDKFASKCKRVFRRLASCERRALYLRRASCGEIYRRAQSVFNRAVRFVVNFTAVRARFDRRSFIAKRLLKTKPTASTARLLPRRRRAVNFKI